jgi:predicted dienelactone hydrolase
MSTIVGSMIADAVHTLDQIEQLDQQDPVGVFTGRLDLDKVGMFGHSAGGATACEACVTKPR